jgi:hypothetical protein
MQKITNDRISTGIAAFDRQLGGGLALGTLALVVEDECNVYAQLLSKYFIAQGLAHAQERVSIYGCGGCGGGGGGSSDHGQWLKGLMGWQGMASDPPSTKRLVGDASSVMGNPSSAVNDPSSVMGDPSSAVGDPSSLAAGCSGIGASSRKVCDLNFMDEPSPESNSSKMKIAWRYESIKTQTQFDEKDSAAIHQPNKKSFQRGSSKLFSKLQEMRVSEKDKRVTFQTLPEKTSGSSSLTSTFDLTRTISNAALVQSAPRIRTYQADILDCDTVLNEIKMELERYELQWLPTVTWSL